MIGDQSESLTEQVGVEFLHSRKCKINLLSQSVNSSFQQYSKFWTRKQSASQCHPALCEPELRLSHKMRRHTLVQEVTGL